MTVHEDWTDQLSDYLDGELPADERSAVEAHLGSCAPCAAVLHDLQRVVACARSAEARPPQADLWAGIADRMETGGPAAEPGLVIPFARRDTRRFTFTLPQLAAAAALVMAVSGGIAWELRAALPGRPEGLRYDGTPSREVGTPSREVGTPSAEVGTPSAEVVQAFRPANSDGASAATDDARAETVNLADAQYDAAVTDLEKALNAGRGRLDASTIAIVEHNLHIIDQAITQAREALVTDPANSYLSGHLVDARRRKLDLLRRATALATDTN